jgi:hypothetical protein
VRTSGPKNYSIEWREMWNERKLVEWNGNGIKINLRNSTRIYEMKRIINFYISLRIELIVYL